MRCSFSGGHGQTSSLPQFVVERSGDVGFGIDRIRVSLWGFAVPGSGFRIENLDRIGQFHHVIEIPGFIITSDMQDIHLAFMPAGNRFEFLDTFAFPFVGPIIGP